jgi:8-oxo-dGTP diphosphatase
MEPVHCPQCGSELIPRKENGYNRQFCPRCISFVYENPVPVVAGIILDVENRILLIKRGVDPCIGKWTLPTGFIEIGEHPDVCILREVKEETNLECNIKKLFGVYQQKGWKYRSVIVLAYLLDNLSGEAKAGDDAVDVRYYEYETLPDIPFESHRHIVRDVFQSPHTNNK